MLREVAAEVAGPADAVAITMTAELSDAFRTKREGVAFVLDAAEDALGDRPLSVLTTAGELVPVAAARARPCDVAAANWVATALAVAGAHPDALLIDIGSTTADIVPIAAGRVAATGHNDLERLLAGELVYTGVLRTNLAAIAPRVPIRGGWCPVSSEYFAISADVHLVLGHLAPEAYDCPTPDGRPATVALRARAHRPAGVRRRRPARRGRDRRDRRLPPRRAGAPDRGRGAPGAASAAARRTRRRGRLRRLPGTRGRRAPRASGRRCPAPWGATGGEVAPAAALAALLAARAVLTVVKVGGGLGRGAGDDALRGVCATLGELGERHPLLVVPGGAGFADAVRDADRRFGLPATTSHRMAILGMEQFGWLLSELIPGAVRCADLARAPPAGRPCSCPPRCPLDALPASWQVTSDSIAAWVADQAGAGRLVLVKEVDGLFAEWPARGEPIARLTVAELAALRPGGRRRVPAHGARRRALRDVGDRRARPARLAELLERGTTVGTRIAAGALATVRPWVTSRPATAGLPPWPTPSSGTTRSSAGSTPSRTAASGPTSSPGSWPACSGIRWPSTSPPTPANGRSSRTSAATA